MGKLPNRWNFPGIRNMDDFVRTILKLLNGNLGPDNISSDYKLLTTVEYNLLIGGVGTDSYVDKSGGTLVNGMPIYFSASGGVHLADASSSTKEARGFCVSTDGSTAYVKTAGLIPAVPIESGITISFGEKIWLSTTAGRVTNVMPADGDLEQELGVATADGTRAGGTVNMNAIIREPLEELL